MHTGVAAEKSDQDVNALAYTVGHYIVFGANRFSSGAHDGRRLIAHELTHVVQQAGGDEIFSPWLQRQPAPCQPLGTAIRAFMEHQFGLQAFTQVHRQAQIQKPIAGGGPILDKGAWFLRVNGYIWQHWRAAFDAIHDPTRRVPSSLTPEWAAAVSICRTSGIESKACCEAQVRAEQTAIDHCHPYIFGHTWSAPQRRAGRSVLQQHCGPLHSTSAFHRGLR